MTEMYIPRGYVLHIDLSPIKEKLFYFSSDFVYSSLGFRSFLGEDMFTQFSLGGLC